LEKFIDKLKNERSTTNLLKVKTLEWTSLPTTKRKWMNSKTCSRLPRRVWMKPSKGWVSIMSPRVAGDRPNLRKI